MNFDSTGNKENKKRSMYVSLKKPYCKDLTQTEHELEQDQYSYPSKCKETNISVEFRNEEMTSQIPTPEQEDTKRQSTLTLIVLVNMLMYGNNADK